MGTRDPVGLVSVALERVRRISDPIERAKASTALAQTMYELMPGVRAVRAEAVSQMKSSGMTYQAIGDELGVHFTRIPQIMAGAGTGRSPKRLQEARRGARRMLLEGGMSPREVLRSVQAAVKKAQETPNGAQPIELTMRDLAELMVQSRGYERDEIVRLTGLGRDVIAEIPERRGDGRRRAAAARLRAQTGTF